MSSCHRVSALMILLLLTLAAVLASADLNSTFQAPSKAKLCALDVENSRQVLELVEVTPQPAPSRNDSVVAVYPRILCFAVTYSAHHQNRVRAVAETWGQRCDKLLFFSNVSDTIVVAANTTDERRYEVVQLDLIADHAHLWLRTRAALRYIYERFRHDYDWFYKTDDDTYVIVENLRQYVKRPEILQAINREPMQLGHRFNLPENAVNHYVKNETLRKQWRSRWSYVVYNSGGSGYVMNRLFLEKIVESLPEWTCLPEESSGTMPEDAGVSFCMAWHGIYPWDTRDHLGRERWHAFPPSLVRLKWENPNDWYVRYHEHVGGVKSGSLSAAPDSAAFHYVRPPLMYHMERVLYLCRAGDDIPHVTAFNQKFQLALGDRVMMQ